jgi:hypothetical protein
MARLVSRGRRSERRPAQIDSEIQDYLTTAMVCVAETDRLKLWLPL